MSPTNQNAHDLNFQTLPRERLHTFEEHFSTFGEQDLFVDGSSHLYSSTMSGNHRRGPWGQQEDAFLMQLVQSQGALNWVRIASILGTRTPKQCRERYHQNLKPSLNHEPITAEEGAIIEELVNNLGKRWAEIARRLHGRSDNAVKNWWNGSQNRRKRMDRRKQPHLTMTIDRDMLSYGGPRSLPFPGHRPLPPPLLPGGGRSAFGLDTPIPSPSIYSPDSDITQSYTSDSYSTSPRSYDGRSPDLELPPLKMSGSSARSSLSPVGEQCKLPPITHLDMSPGLPNSPPSYARSPTFPRCPADFEKQPFTTSCEYLSQRSHLPTAPNSPDGCLSAPIRMSLPEDRGIRQPARVAVTSLLT